MKINLHIYTSAHPLKKTDKEGERQTDRHRHKDRHKSSLINCLVRFRGGDGPPQKSGAMEDEDVLT